VLEPRLDPAKLRKGQGGRVEIGLTHPESKSIQIPFSILAKYNVSPPTIVLLNVPVDEVQKRQVWVLNNYNEEFEVESTSSKSGQIKVVKQVKQGNRYSFDLEITPPAPETARPTIFRDEFYVKVKGDETLTVFVTGFYQRK